MIFHGCIRLQSISPTKILPESSSQAPWPTAVAIFGGTGQGGPREDQEGDVTGRELAWGLTGYYF